MGIRRNLGAALTMGAMATTKLKEAQEGTPESPRATPVNGRKVQRTLRKHHGAICRDERELEPSKRHTVNVGGNERQRVWDP